MILTRQEKLALITLMNRYASMGLAGREPIEEVLMELTPDEADHDLYRLEEAQEWLERNLPMGWKLHE